MEDLLSRATIGEALHLFYEGVWVPSKPERYPPPGSTVEFRDGYFAEELKTVDGVIKCHYLSGGRERSTVDIVGRRAVFVGASYDAELRRGGTWRPKGGDK